MRLSPRRKGWPARDVKAWLDGLDGGRHKTRVQAGAAELW
jgi:hypothetical protein